MLKLPRPLSQQMLRHLLSVYPEEGCGLVSGRAGQATQVIPIENILHSRTAYEMDPLPQVKAMLAMEERGEALLAIYHSHPHGPPWPSVTDVQQSYYPETVYLIISLADQASPQIRGFYILDETISEVIVAIE